MPCCYRARSATARWRLGASLAARTRLAAFIADRPDLAVAAITAEPLTGRVTLRDVAFAHGAWRVTVGALHLPVARSAMMRTFFADEASASPFSDKPSPSAVAPQPAATPVPVTGAGTASAENVVIVAGATTYRIKRVDMTGTSLTSVDLAAMLDSKAPTTLEARLRRLTASAIVIPEIASDDRTPGSERHATLQQVVLAGVAAGHVAAGSASGGTFTIKDAQDLVNGSLGTIEATGMDLGQIAHVFGTVRTDDAEPILPLYDSVTVNAVKLTNVTKNSTLSVSAIKEAGAKARALKTDLTAASPKPSGDPRSAALFDDAVHSFVVGSLEVIDLVAHNEAPEGSDDFGVTRASVSNFGDGRLGGADVRGFHFAGSKEGKFGVGALVIGPVVLPAAAGATSAMLPPTGKLDIADLDVDVVSQDKGAQDKGDQDKAGQDTAGRDTAGRDTAGKDATAATAAPARVKFKVAHLAAASEGNGGPIPRKASVTIDNVTFDAPKDDSSGVPLYGMGYRRIDMSGSLASTYDAVTQDLSVDKLVINGTGMGTLDLSLALANVGTGIVSSNQEVAQASLIAVVAKAVDLKLADDGLFSKAIAWKAGRDGLSVDQEREAGIDFFTNGVPSLVNNNPKVKAIGTAVAKFIADPRSLHVAIASRNGVGIAAMGMLATPDVLLDTLDIKAGADQ